MPLLSEEPFPWVFDMSQYFKKILPALESVLSSQQDQIYFNYGWWHCWEPVTSPNMYLPTPRVQKSGDVLKSLHCKNIIFDNVRILSENHPKAFRMFPMSITACENHANFLPFIVQCDWLISNQLQFDCSVLCFSIENSSNKSTKSSSCFIFLFDISEITKLIKKNFEKGNRRFAALTGRRGDLMKNLETPGKTRRVGRYTNMATFLAAILDIFTQN